uniref:Tantalus-like domain-containing protein n=1 Tax=Amphiprion percula TaxID=161767 RepID=A0A3P8RM80_AMPPE
MLTYPSDLLPKIVCPMDEDAIPPNPFCSAPPHSEPPPPVLPLSSVTPSCAGDGSSGHRRSGRIQAVRAQTPNKHSNADSRAAQKPSRQNPSPAKRERQIGNMVQVSQSKQPRVERAHAHEKQNEDGLDLSFTAERQNKQRNQKSPRKKTDVFPGESEVEQLAKNAAKNVDAAKSDINTCRELAAADTVENASAPKGWVIGPLFQSFKSKMASFTEIVMSPVKLFRANSPPPSMGHPDKLSACELEAAETTDAEHSEPSNMFHSGQIEYRNQDTETTPQRLTDVETAHNTETFVLKYSKKLDFDMELSTHSFEQAAEFAINQKDKISPDLVPFTHTPLPCIVSEPVSESVGSIRSSVSLRSTANVSASNESKLNMSSAVEDQKGKVASRLKTPAKRRTGNRSEFKRVNLKTLTSEDIKEESDSEVNDRQLSHQYSVKSNNSHSDKMPSLSSSVYHTQPDSDSLQPDGGDCDVGNTDSCSLTRQSLHHNLSDGATKRTLEPSMDTLQPQYQLVLETCSGIGSGRAKRVIKPNCNSQDSVKRKRLIVDPEDTKKELLNLTSDTVKRRELRPPRKEVVLLNTSTDGKETLKAARTRPSTSARANRKGKGGQEMLATINETILHMQTASSPDAMLISSLDKSCSVLEDNQKDCSSKAKPSSSCKRQKTRTVLSKADVNIDNGMDLETTVAITSTKQAEEEPLSEVLVRPDIKQLQSKCRNTNKKPLKRKSPNQASSMTEPGSTLVCNTVKVLLVPLELMRANLNTSQHVQKEENSARGQSQPSKRPKKGLRDAVQSSSGTQETKQCISNPRLLTKDCQTKEGKCKISTDPVYFEMTPFENIPKPLPSPSKPLQDCCVQLHNEYRHLTDGKEKCGADEIFLTDSEVSNNSSINLSRLRSSTRRVNIKPRRAENQRRKCRVLHSRMRKGEEMAKSVTMEDADVTTSGGRSLGNGLLTRLLRSYSCPEIPSLCHQDMSWTSSVLFPHHSRTHISPHHHQPSHSSFVSNKSQRRARRHTVCSIEIEREIAPLCLRKEVYPSRRSASYDALTQHLSPSLALSPSSSLTALASCFLSSPLAFLSKKVDSRGATASSPSTSTHACSPSSSSLLSPLSSSSWHLQGFHARNDSSAATLDSNGSENQLECETERRQQSEEEDDGEDTSSSSQEFEDIGLREEKALSDSEIKVVKKHEERGKVSSIRIRKTLPKPQTNLTPMGLPKPIRLKKKEFSLEEIYTNKNFSKPPESRLETIFEVPLNRKNGSESWFGQRRVKRFLEFLEVGEARKPKKPLLGVGKAGISSSRTRRGGFPKDEPSLSVQDMDSLLCAKLDQLNLWLTHDQNDS